MLIDNGANQICTASLYMYLHYIQLLSHYWRFVMVLFVYHGIG